MRQANFFPPGAVAKVQETLAKMHDCYVFILQQTGGRDAFGPRLSAGSVRATPDFLGHLTADDRSGEQFRGDPKLTNRELYWLFYPTDAPPLTEKSRVAWVTGAVNGPQFIWEVVEFDSEVPGTMENQVLLAKSPETVNVVWAGP